MFGDNKTVMESGTRPQPKLLKRHTALSFHQVWDAIAAKIIGFYHISGEINPAATYGSELIGARTCMEQLIDLRLTLR